VIHRGLPCSQTILASMQLGTCGPLNHIGLAPLEPLTPAPRDRDLSYAYDDN
jgi:hypothetical protein